MRANTIICPHIWRPRRDSVGRRPHSQPTVSQAYLGQVWVVCPIQVGDVRGIGEHIWGWSKSSMCVLSGLSVRIAPQLHPIKCHSERAFPRPKASEESGIYMNWGAVTGESNPEPNHRRRSWLVYSPLLAGVNPWCIP